LVASEAKAFSPTSRALLHKEVEEEGAVVQAKTHLPQEVLVVLVVVVKERTQEVLLGRLVFQEL